MRRIKKKLKNVKIVINGLMKLFRIDESTFSSVMMLN